MRNDSLWKPTIIEANGTSFRVNEKGIYGGSFHVVEKQIQHYLPIFRKYISGNMLDVGCGKVPYWEICKPLVTNHYCIDHPTIGAGSDFIDASVDLNHPWELNQTFDSILCTDVMAHVQNPFILFENLSAHLKKSGFLVVTTPFQYWMSHPQHEYFHPTEGALQHLCAHAGLEVVHLESYGHLGDIRLDLLNKRWDNGWSYRCFKLFKKLFINSPFYRANQRKNTFNWSLGYVLVARIKE